VADEALTINEFCALEKISRTVFYDMQRLGVGPLTYRVGTFQRISAEARRAWQASREADMATAREAIKAAKAARAARVAA
jgi:hypothetical protein